MITEFNYSKFAYMEKYIKSQYAKRGVELETKILGKTALFYDTATRRTVETLKIA